MRLILQSLYLHGTSISPILNFEGYVFHRFEYNGVTYEDIDDVLQVTDNLNDIRVYYRRIIFEITFTQLKEGTTDQYETVIRYVHYNDSLEPENVPVIYNPFVGMTAIWERSVFNNVRTNLNISVLFFDNETKTIKFTDDQSVIFVASQGDLPASTVFIGATSPIWNLSKPGYRFLGWYYLDSEDIETKLMPGNYAFDNPIFSENITEIYTKWYKLIPYDEPTNLNVSVNNKDDIIITWTLYIGELAVPQFEIYIDKELVELMKQLM